MVAALLAVTLCAGSGGAEALARSFSPDVVGALTLVKPSAGEYAMALSLQYEEFITTELRVTERRTGALKLSLAAGGDARACAGMRSASSTSGQYHYEPPERRQGTRSEENVQLLALAGRWRVEQGVVVVTFDRVAWSTCDVGAASALPEPQVELRCVAFSPTKRLPAAGLACEQAEKGQQLLELGMPMNGAKRERGLAPRGRNVLLGVPGLQVEVNAARGAASLFTLRARPATFNEADWLRPAPKKK